MKSKSAKLARPKLKEKCPTTNDPLTVIQLPLSGVVTERNKTGQR